MKNKKYPIDYPTYPKGEDIYKKYKEESEIDPEDPTRLKADIEAVDETPKPLDFTKFKADEDLDVPGAELDDDQEQIGSEDEENNYYSLGGDNHESLEEHDFADDELGTVGYDAEEYAERLGADPLSEEDFDDDNLGEEDLGEEDLEEDDIRG
ncbi:MAG TPA: hypothetical protein VL947_11595 [Cytophagales bacterium]|nr:hypothetical protein [Cytophagales bacterium]